MIIRNVLLIGGAMIAFGVIHSLLAGADVKSRLKDVLGERVVEGWYRLFYNVVAVITLLPALVLVAVLPGQVLYQVPMPWALVLIALQAVGLVGLVVAFFSFDGARFLGLSQAAAFLTGDPLPLPEEEFHTGGLYGLVRHPLYFFSLLLIWPTPTMTLNVLIFNVFATLYFIVGSWIEERRLRRLYGEQYHAYQDEVPWLIPFIG